MKKSRWFYLILFLIFVFSLSLKTPVSEWNQDLGRHLKMGELIIKKGAIPEHNLFSYTHPNFTFLNHHWLAEVIFFLVFKYLGVGGLVFLKTILILLSFFLIFLSLPKKSWRGFLLPLWLLSAFVFRERVDVRPEFFGFFFFALFIFILSREKEKRKLFFFLPLLQALWVNIHLSFVFGLFLTGIWLIEKILQRTSSWEDFKISFLVFIASFFNPHFWRGALYPFLIFRNYGYSIVENQNIFFLQKLMDNPNIFFFKIAFLTGFLLFIISRNRSPFCLLGFFILAGVSAWQIRHFPFFALFFLYTLNRNFLLIEKRYSFLWIKIRKHELNFSVFTVSFTILLIFLYISNFYYQTHDQKSQFGFLSKPPAEAAARFLLRSAGKIKIFNNFDIGSFLDYSLYPQIKVFADSRPEAYPSEFWQEYEKAQNEKAVWQETVKKYDIKAVFFAYSDATPWGKNFLKKIINNQNWRLVYLDSTIAIWFKKNFKPKTKEIKEEDVLSLSTNFNRSIEFIELSDFCRKVGWLRAEKALLEKALKLQPYSRWANRRLSQIYLLSGKVALQFKAQNLISRLKNPIFWF